jgi:hypothetical protein
MSRGSTSPTSCAISAVESGCSARGIDRTCSDRPIERVGGRAQTNKQWDVMLLSAPAAYSYLL